MMDCIICLIQIVFPGPKIHAYTEFQLPTSFRYKVMYVMGNNQLLLPGTSKITFQPNPFVLLLCGLIYIWIPNPNFQALLDTKLGSLWK